MKLHYHPVSTTSRTVVWFAQEQGITLDLQVVDLFTGEHCGERFAAINPNCLVPVLEDGDFRLTESSAILKYLADRAHSLAYPTELKARARVNEVMDWFNANLYRDLGYGVLYPQVFPHHRRATDELQAGTIAWSQEKAKAWLTILDKHILGDKPFLCGNEITLADYFAAPVLTAADLIAFDFSPYPNVMRWLNSVKARDGWKVANAAFYGLVDQVRSAPAAA
jgi:glutathione S-transferase